MRLPLTLAPAVNLLRRTNRWVAIGGLLIAALTTLIAVTAIVSVVTTPLAALSNPIGALFGSSPSTSNASDDDKALTQAIATCVDVDRTTLTDAVSSVAPGTDADTAQAWVMYSLAHLNSRTRGLPIDSFARRWRAANPTTVPPSDVPTQLEAADPTTTTYPRWTNAGLVAAFQMATSHTITLPESAMSAIASDIASACHLDDTATPAPTA